MNKNENGMGLLRTRGREIVRPDGTPIQLTGTNLGCWMCMEYMSLGLMGVENRYRSCAESILGESRAKAFFDSFQKHFITEKEIRYLSDGGANVVRVPLNYRHFEDDRRPFHYIEEGFSKLDRVLDWCERYGIYVIIDLHAVQGSQSPDWHADSTARYAGFWNDVTCQERFLELWKVIADRYKNRNVVAGYEIMNEPATGQILQLPEPYVSNWPLINKIYRRTVSEIRKIDPDHIIILDGDNWSKNFDGLDAPFADNLVYSSHNYSDVEFLINEYGGTYPGLINGVLWDKEKIREEFFACQGTQFALKYNVPLFIGETGSHHQTAFLSDQLDVINEFGAHWTTWTVKDIGYTAMLRLDPDGFYMKKMGDIVDKFNPTDGRSMIPERAKMKKLIRELTYCIFDAVGDPSLKQYDSAYKLQRTVDDVFYGNLVHPLYFRRIAGMSEDGIEELMKSYDIENCIEHPIARIEKAHFYKNAKGGEK